MLQQNKFLFFFVFFIYIFNPTTGKTQEQSLWKNLGLYGGQINSIAADPKDSSILYAGSWTGDGLFKSTDSGETWLSIPQDNPDNPSWFRNMEVKSIAVDPNNSLNIWVANGSYLDVSHDGGTSWKTFFFASDEDRFCYTVAVDPHDLSGNTVYVGTGGKDYSNEKGEIFVTADGGETWDNMHFTADGNIWYNFWDISFNPHKPGEIWVANRKSYISPEGHIYMSPDYGSSWWYWTGALYANEDYRAFGFIDEVIVHPENPLLVFVSTSYGIARKLDGASLDESSRWQWTDVTESSTAVCIPPAAPDTVYASLAGGTVRKSTDSGATWSTSLAAPDEFLTMEPHPSAADTLYAGCVDKGVFKTSDGARSWEPINQGIKANTIYAIDIFPGNPARVLCGTLAGVYLYKGENAWQELYSYKAEAVAFNPDNAGTLYWGTHLGTGWEIFKSIDSGSTWISKSSENEEDSKVTSIAVIPSEGGKDTIIAGIGYSSGKKGEVVRIVNWDYETYENFDITLSLTVPVNAVAVHPQQQSLMFAGSGSFYAPSAPGRLYKSADGGKTWKKLRLPGIVTVNAIAIHPTDPCTVFVGCGASSMEYSGMFKSTNCGVTWKSITNGLPEDFSVSDIKFDRADNNIVYASLYKGYNASNENLGGTYITLDGGEYWTQIGLSDYLLYAVNSTEVDGANAGRTAALKSGRTISFPSSTVLAGSASGLYQSTTAGTGIITGTITSADNGRAITGALVSAFGSNGQSVEGYYLLLVPAGVHSLVVTAPGYAQVVPPSVAVSAGQSVEQNIVMAPADQDNSSNCLAGLMLKGSSRSADLQALRNLRDHFLAKTPIGRRFTSLYYDLGNDIRPVLQKSPGLKQRCAQLIGRSLPYARLALSGEKTHLPAFLMDDISSFLFDLEAASPPDTKKKINKLRQELKQDTIKKLFSPSGTGR